MVKDSGMQQSINIIGAGLAGCEAAYYLAELGFQVILYEMRPKLMTPAHKTDQCAELVCSNSFKSKSPYSAPGMLKAELSKLGSLTLRAAGSSVIEAGEALAVDRKIFAETVTRAISSHPNIVKINQEVTSAPEKGITIIASGPLTSDGLTNWLLKKTGSENLYFYDAIAPVIDASTIDLSKAFVANRYGKGG